jgi:hypothetical protein
MGYANQVLKILKRVTPLVQSSSMVAAEDRNSVEEHYKSLEAMNILNVSRQITLVDDFVTQGRTAYACYLRIREKYPDSEIRLFSLFGTYSTFGHAEESEKTTLFNPTFDIISYNERSGKTIRHTKYTD